MYLIYIQNLSIFFFKLKAVNLQIEIFKYKNMP